MAVFFPWRMVGINYTPAMPGIVAPALGMAEALTVTDTGIIGSVVMAIDNDNMPVVPVEGTEEKYRCDVNAMAPVKAQAGVVTPRRTPVKGGINRVPPAMVYPRS